MEAKVVWQSDLTFEVQQDGHKFIIDADDNVGGHDRGPRPKGLVLSGLVGCTGMDVISILKKMRVDVENFEVKASAELTNEHPKVFTKIHIQYIFHGNNLPMGKLEKAVNLSQERYCGVSAMLRTIAEISHEIIVKKVEAEKSI